MKLIKATKVLILLPLFVFGFLAGKAYCEDVDPHDINDVTYISFGATTLNTGNLNDVLTKNNYQPFQNYAMTWGTGSRNISGNFMTGSEGNFTFENKAVGGN